MISINKTTKIQNVMDLTMLVLIIIASFTLVFQQTQYWYFMVLIMFGFLYYLIKFRLSKYYVSTPKYVIHQLNYNQNKQRNKQQMINKTIFLQDFEKRSTEMARRDANRDGSLDKSYLSYMNKSKLANSSLQKSRLSARNLKNNETGFQFLNQRNQEKLLSQSSIRRFQNSRSKDDSISSDDYREDLQKIKQDNMRKCTTRYIETLNKLETQQKRIKQMERNGLDKIKTICLNLSIQVLRQNIDNLKNIVLALQQIYEIKVNCKQFSDLDRAIGIQNKKLDYAIQINLIRVIQNLLKSKNSLLDYSQRKQKNILSFNQPVSNYYLAKDTNKSKVGLSETKQKLKLFVQQRKRLNAYFYEKQNHSLSVSNLIHRLKILKQHEEEQKNQQSYYQIKNAARISQQYSQRLLLVFNVSRNKINQIVNQYQKTLQYRIKSFFGWISTQKSQFQIAETLNSDNGHPHYDLNINSVPKTTLYCQFGPQNGYSVLFMYLFVLQKRYSQFVRQNIRLNKILMEAQIY